MTDSIELEVAITRAKLTKQEIASKLGITAMGLYKKINNLSEFKASEIVILSKLLKLTNSQREKIFFTNFVDLKSTNKR